MELARNPRRLCQRHDGSGCTRDPGPSQSSPAIPVCLQIYEWGCATSVFLWNFWIHVPFSGAVLSFLSSTEFVDSLRVMSKALSSETLQIPVPQTGFLSKVKGVGSASFGFSKMIWSGCSSGFAAQLGYALVSRIFGLFIRQAPSGNPSVVVNGPVIVVEPVQPRGPEVSFTEDF